MVKYFNFQVTLLVIPKESVASELSLVKTYQSAILLDELIQIDQKLSAILGSYFPSMYTLSMHKYTM